MKIFNIIFFLLKAKEKHFISVDYKVYKKWKYLIKGIVLINSNYIPCQIYRSKFKRIKKFVVVGLKYNGKNVKRRTSGYAKKYIKNKRHACCFYCGIKLNDNNATADHIVPVSNGGNNTQVNLVVCCKDCNLERGNQSFRNFLKLKNIKYKSVEFI